ncbi:WYL domain-containing protein [Streptomyces sp. NPDC007172]|uniref:WYL domain-containing protein n=1 Tax=Streptomyces sp. NPDC007172 TaxID=3364776 RepID=UPI003677C2BB
MVTNLRWVPPTVGTHRPDGPDASVVEVGGHDADGLARYLLSLATPLRVLSPDEVREALLRRARDLCADNASGLPRLPTSGDAGPEASS